MTFGFPARFVEERWFNVEHNNLADVISRALVSLGWRWTQSMENELRAKVNMNLWSWGEDVLVRVLPEGMVHVESRCATFTQCLDWGKNRENVERFLAQVEQETRALIASPVSGKEVRVFDEQGRTPIERVFSKTESE